MLAYELYLKNRESNAPPVKTVAPIKKAFVKVENSITVQLDPKTLEHYGESISQKNRNFIFQKSLSMPSNNLSSVGLPYRGTGAAAKKPYVELYGTYKKGKLTISLQGNAGKDGKQKYEYIFDFANGKEDVLVPVESIVLRLDKKNYFVDEKLLFDIYKEVGIVTEEGALSSKVFIEVCKAFSSLWQQKISPDELKEFSSFSFRIVILPFSLMSQGQIEYRSCAEILATGESFEDCFGNQANDYPTSTTINAKFLSFDDEAFTINCRTGKQFYQNIGIGDQSFPKINLPNDGFRIAGLEWYFFGINEPLLNFEETRTGIYDQLLSNYQLMAKNAGDSVTNLSVMKVICVKKAQAKLEVLLDENLTLDQLKHMFSRAQDNMSSHPMALESLIIKRKTDVIWTDYIAAVGHFMHGTFFNRNFLIQRLTLILRNNYLWSWIKGNKLDREEKEGFFKKSQFCLKLLTNVEREQAMNKNEEYAYKIGCIAGKFVRFKRENREANNSTNDILTYPKYDRERLRYVYRRIGNSISLSKANSDSINLSLKDDVPSEEIDDVQAHEDYSYFFYKGVFQNLT